MTATALPEVTISGAEEPGPRRRLRRARAGGLGALVAASVYGLLDAGVVPGPWAVLLPVLLVVAVPVASGLARRISVNGALVLGWIPMSWLVRWPVDVNHGALLVAVGAAALTAWVAGAARPTDALRRLVPTVARVDILVLVAGACALVTVRPWLMAGSPRQTLRLLIPGYDNAGHFDMFLMLRTHGATIDTLGAAPDGSGWFYDNYPQGFHALLATYGDLAAPRIGNPAAELVLYAHAMAGVVALATVVLVATVCSVPALRGRPWVLLPAAVVVVTALLWEPGARLLASGFASFWFASLCAAGAVVLALGTGERRTSSVATVAAVAALVTGVALAWTPLLVLAGPAVLAVWPTRRTLWSGARTSTHRRVSFALLAFMASGVLKAVYLLVTTISVSEVVVAHGQVSGAPFPVVLVLLLVSVAALVRLCARRGSDCAADRRMWWLVLTPVGGFAALTTLLALQMRALGTSSYYFLKLLVGYEVVLAALAAVAVAVLVATTVPVRKGVKLRVLASLTVAVTLTQSLGFVSWSAAPMLHPRLNGTDSAGRPLDLTAMADGILASAIPAGRVGSDRVYVAIGLARGFDGVLPAAWHHALTGTLSRRAHDRIGTLGGTLSDAETATPYVRDLLEKDGSVTVVVEPPFVAPLRASLGAELGERVVALPSSGR